MVERVQHRFTRLFPELRVMTYEARLKALKLWSLEERRNRADLIEVYKLMHGFTDIPVSTYFHIATDSCARGHTKKLVKSHCHTDARLCFLLRVINRWNSLSQEILDAPSVNAFKRHLESVRQKKMGYFMDSVRTTLLAAGYARYDVICLCYMMIAFGAATPGELSLRSPC